MLPFLHQIGLFPFLCPVQFLLSPPNKLFKYDVIFFLISIFLHYNIAFLSIVLISMLKFPITHVVYLFCYLL